MSDQQSIPRRRTRLTQLWRHIAGRLPAPAAVADATPDTIPDAPALPLSWEADTARLLVTGNGCAMCDDEGCDVCISQTPRPRAIASGTNSPKNKTGGEL